MRYKLVFDCQNDCQLPIDYPYILNSIIQQFTGDCISPQPHLEKCGVSLFSYSPFLVKNKSIDGESNLITLHANKLYWIVSCPIQEQLERFVQNISAANEITVFGNQFHIASVVKTNEPVFASRMKFICLSPISVIKSIINVRKNYIYYNYNEDFSEPIKQTLKKKYRLLYAKEPPEGVFKITFDEAYINRRNGRVMKLLSIVEPDGFIRKVKGTFAPLEMEAHPELIQLAYATGLGDLTNYGLGTLDLVS